MVVYISIQLCFRVSIKDSESSRCNKSACLNTSSFKILLQPTFASLKVKKNCSRGRADTALIGQSGC